MNRKIKEELPVWVLLTVSVNKTVEQRNNLSENEVDTFTKKALNASLVLNLTSILEGSLKDILIEYLKIHNTEEDIEQFNRSRTTFDGRSTYNDKYKEYVGKKLTEIIDNKTYQAIVYLFRLRNVLVHGKSFSILYSEDKPNGEIQEKNYEDVHKYLSRLSKQGIFNYPSEGDIKTTEMYNNNILDFFIAKANSFINQVLQYSEKNPKIYLEEYLKQYIAPLI